MAKLHIIIREITMSFWCFYDTWHGIEICVTADIFQILRCILTPVSLETFLQFLILVCEKVLQLFVWVRTDFEHQYSEALKGFQTMTKLESLQEFLRKHTFFGNIK